MKLINENKSYQKSMFINPYEVLPSNEADDDDRSNGNETIEKDSILKITRK